MRLKIRSTIADSRTSACDVGEDDAIPQTRNGLVNTGRGIQKDEISRVRGWCFHLELRLAICYANNLFGPPPGV